MDCLPMYLRYLYIHTYIHTYCTVLYCTVHMYFVCTIHTHPCRGHLSFVWPFVPLCRRHRFIGPNTLLVVCMYVCMYAYRWFFFIFFSSFLCSGILNTYIYICTVLLGPVVFLSPWICRCAGRLNLSRRGPIGCLLLSGTAYICSLGSWDWGFVPTYIHIHGVMR